MRNSIEFVTTNHGGLGVRARLGRRSYPIGKKISRREFSQRNIVPANFHGAWNYVVRPRPQPR
jgi:Rhodopirellula transposase DDE domain